MFFTESDVVRMFKRQCWVNTRSNGAGGFDNLKPLFGMVELCGVVSLIVINHEVRVPVSSRIRRRPCVLPIGVFSIGDSGIYRRALLYPPLWCHTEVHRSDPIYEQIFLTQYTGFVFPTLIRKNNLFDPHFVLTIAFPIPSAALLLGQILAPFR